jgi:hypothetical protein
LKSRTKSKTYQIVTRLDTFWGRHYVAPDLKRHPDKFGKRRAKGE